jgi:hypothetical protein
MASIAEIKKILNANEKMSWADKVEAYPDQVFPKPEVSEPDERSSWRIVSKKRKRRNAITGNWRIIRDNKNIN